MARAKVGNAEAKGTHGQGTYSGLGDPGGPLKLNFTQTENTRSISELLGVKDETECSKKREAVPGSERIKN